jgi:hypothetical protein
VLKPHVALTPPLYIKAARCTTGGFNTTEGFNTTTGFNTTAGFNTTTGFNTTEVLIQR